MKYIRHAQRLPNAGGPAPRTSANKIVLPLLVACFKWRPN
jgi:hypothetical protein